jgi:hypothetical protein
MIQLRFTCDNQGNLLSAIQNLGQLIDLNREQRVQMPINQGFPLQSQQQTRAGHAVHSYPLTQNQLALSSTHSIPSTLQTNQCMCSNVQRCNSTRY